MNPISKEEDLNRIRKKQPYEEYKKYLDELEKTDKTGKMQEKTVKTLSSKDSIVNKIFNNTINQK